jgi:Cytochrome c7 and related cytochrome c
VACEACHAQGKKFAAAPHECPACHDKDQPHKGQLGTKCEACHNVERWTKVAAFNHDTTKFPLKGAHAKVGCLSCHAGEVYKGVSTACNDCHALQDVHATRFGTACQDCHTVETWKGAKFDHAKSTRFPLLGVHAQAKCGDCHGGNVRQKISMACFDCHKSQDVHKAQLGSQCGECHGTAGWRQDVKFDHGLTSYPLTGLHTAVACESCHASAAFRGAPRACVACHASDDTHAGRFASRCEDCHSANGWQRVAFDHGRDTRFKLTGAHAKTGCYACHTQKNVKSASLPATCYACHKAQDVHHGAFGQDCTRCHTTATFKSAFIRQ